MTTTVQITQLFQPTVLGTSAATFYTAPTLPSTTTVARVRVRFANTTSGAVAVTAYAIQSGGTAGAANECIPGESIPANGHTDYDMPMLAPGGFYQAFAGSATSITVTCLNGTVFS